MQGTSVALWQYFGFSALTWLLLVMDTSAMSCERARLDCAYRDGCAHALHLYLRHCDARSLRRDANPHCPRECQYALIALTSTPEGKRLTTVK